MRHSLLVTLAFFVTTNAIADTEPNNSWQSALALPQDRTVAGTQSDDDWYFVNPSFGNRILIDLTFSNAEGNIDMTFYGDDFIVSEPTNTVPGLFRDISASMTTDHEFIDHNISIAGPGAYYIKVSGENLGNDYTLTWTELAAADDGFEVNNTGAAAKVLSENVIAFGVQADEDWYSIEVDSSNTRVLASLRFYNTELANTIDLDLELRATGGTLLASSAMASGINESINVDVGVAGTYHLRILGDNNADGYALNWAGVNPGSSEVFPAPGVNDAPTAIPNTVITDQNTPYSFAVNDFAYSDSEGDSLVSAMLSNLSLAGGALTHSSGIVVDDGDTLAAAQLASLVYVPSVDSTGSPLATFDFTVNDFDTGTVAAQMAINVNADATTTDTGASDTTTTDTGSSDTTAPTTASELDIFSTSDQGLPNSSALNPIPTTTGSLTPMWILLMLIAGFLGRRNS